MNLSNHFCGYYQGVKTIITFVQVTIIDIHVITLLLNMKKLQFNVSSNLI